MRDRHDAPSILEIQVDTPPEWRGWHFEGRYFVTPDGQRLTAQRIRGIAMRDHLELRKAGFASRKSAERNQRRDRHHQFVKVVIVDLAEYRANGLAAG